MKKTLIASIMFVMIFMLTSCNCNKCSKEEVEVKNLNSKQSCDVICSDKQCDTTRCPRKILENNDNVDKKNYENE